MKMIPVTKVRINHCAHWRYPVVGTLDCILCFEPGRDRCDYGVCSGHMYQCADDEHVECKSSLAAEQIGDTLWSNGGWVSRCGTFFHRQCCGVDAKDLFPRRNRDSQWH